MTKTKIAMSAHRHLCTPTAARAENLFGGAESA
jgi:hypothetical protein